jgi:peptidoglycan/xylan/chitin deacetylase (PgdA/CDA1 family)
MPQFGGATILTYHSLDDSASVISISAERFERHIRHLANRGYQCLRVSEIVPLLDAGSPLPRKAVAITFDDGYLNNLESAVPILRRYGFSATVFVATGHIGATNCWPNQHRSIPRLRMMNAGDLVEFRAAGMDVGAHTVSHPRLPTLEPRTCRNEIVDSKHHLEDILQERVPLFSYPYGQYDSESLDVVAEHFDGAISNRLGRVSARSNRYALERLNATSGIFRRLPINIVSAREFSVYINLKEAADRLQGT